MDISDYKTNFEEYASQETHLSIEISSNLVNLAFLAIDSNTYYAVESLNRTDDFLAASKLLKTASPKSVSCSFNSLDFTLVPHALFDESEIETYLNFNGNENSSKTLHSNSEKQEITTCYAVNSTLITYLLSNFPNIEFKHLSSILIDSVSQGVHINFSSNNTFECLFVNEKGLLFYNGYEYSSAEETLYFLSLICDKFELDVQKIKISVSGIITDDVLALWDSYIPKNNLDYKTIFEYYSFSEALKPLTKHKYFGLIKQHACV